MSSRPDASGLPSTAIDAEWHGCGACARWPSGQRRGSPATERLAASETYQASRLLAVNWLGEPFNPRWFSDEYHRLRTRAGLSRITLHDVRRTFSTKLHESAVLAIQDSPSNNGGRGGSSGGASLVAGPWAGPAAARRRSGRGADGWGRSPHSDHRRGTRSVRGGGRKQRQGRRVPRAHARPC